MPDNKQASSRKRYEAYLKGELEAAAMYNSLAGATRDSERAEVFRELAATEMRHAGRWAEKLGIPIESLQPKTTLRTRFYSWLARRFGIKAVLPVVLRGEYEDMAKYDNDPEAVGLPEEERGHARALAGMAQPAAPASILERESWHRTGASGTLRAAVLGVNDGLVSNFSLVMGVAGGTAAAGGDPFYVLLAGLAGLFAGAFSMAAGEYVSMKAQRDMFEHQLSIEKTELLEHPEEERDELALIYRAKGLPRADAEKLASHILANPNVALDTLAREELGLDPSELGSPWGAALSSFVAFAAGAIVPIGPYLIVRTGVLPLALSAGLGALALMVVGGALSVLTGRSPLAGAGRMLVAGGLAAGVTYGIGRLVGASLVG
ncbi:MAG: VIT1/CCC1 transporter family protein [Chloroflexota bacterium]|nr:VIT1/CCC1 transporter family protein [Chloroflexota bacterium]